MEVVEKLWASAEQKYSDHLSEIQKLTEEWDAEADINTVLWNHNTVLRESMTVLERKLRNKKKKLSLRKKEAEVVESSLREVNTQNQVINSNYEKARAELKELEKAWAQQAKESVKALEEA